MQLSKAGGLSVTAFGLAVALLIVTTSVAFAYVDPSAGGMLIQLFVGGLMAGFIMIGRIFWSNITSIFRFGKKRGDIKEEEAPQATDQGPDHN